GMQSLARELNRAAAELARDAVREWQAKAPERPRFVAGVLGPTNKTASISPDVNDPGFRAISFDELVAAYDEALDGLLEGGVDLLPSERRATQCLRRIRRHARINGAPNRRVGASRLDQHRGRLLRHDARAHRRHGAGARRRPRARAGGTAAGAAAGGPRAAQ